MSALSHLTRPERAVAWAGFAALAMVLAGHELLETARDALFLASIPASRLPLLYIGIAVVGLTIARRLESSHLTSRARDCRPVASMALLASAVSLGLWFVMANPQSWMLYGLYLWTGVSTSIIVVQIWNLISEAFTPTRAKRAFPFIATGGVVGAIFGSAIARAMAQVTEPRHLILAGSIALLIAAVGTIPRLHGESLTDDAPSPTVGTTQASFFESAKEVLGHKYASHLALLAIFGSVTLTVADYVLKSTVSQQVDAADLATFFATLNLATNGVSLFVQLFVVGWVMRRVSTSSAVSILPAVSVVAALAVAAGTGLVGAIAFFAAGATLSHSLYRTASELLFVPLSSRLRRHAKTLIAIGAQRGGKALASVILLGMAAVNAPIWLFGGLGALLAVGWFVGALRVRSAYVAHFRAALRDALIDTRDGLPELDADSLELLAGALNDPDDQRVVAAIKLLDAEHRTSMIPTLILYHPSINVMNASIAVMTKERRPGLIPIAKRIMRETSDPERRARLLTGCTVIEPDREFLEHWFDGQCELTRGVAGMLLAANGWMSVEDAGALIAQTVRHGSPSQRAVLAAAAGVSNRDCLPLLAGLVMDSNAQVVLAALASIEALAYPEFGPILVNAIHGPHWRHVVDTIARSNLASVEQLVEALGDLSNSRTIRRRLVVAITRSGVEGSLAIQRRLPQEDDGAVRYRMIRELERMAGIQDGFQLDRVSIDELLIRLRYEALAHISVHRSLRSNYDGQIPEDTAEGLLVALLKGRQTHLAEAILRVYGIRDKDIDAAGIVEGMKNRAAAIHATASELIESTLPRRDGRIVLVLFAEIRDGEIAAELQSIDATFADAVVMTSSVVGSESVRLLVAHLTMNSPTQAAAAPPLSVTKPESNWTPRLATEVG